MDVKELRRAHLERLLDTEPGPSHGKRARFARRIGKSATQLSQWLSGYRSLDDETARGIEAKVGLARWTLDLPPATGYVVQETAPPTLGQALAVLGAALEQEMADDVRQDAADLLHKLAIRHGAPRHQTELIALLQAPRGKLPAAA